MQALADISAARPDYAGRSIVNLMSSMLAGCGTAPRYVPLALLAPERIAGARHVVLVVIDGLGHDFLRTSSAAPTLNAHLLGAITSVFPPTTAAAVTTFLTGLAPQQHGLTGWFMFLREIATVVSILPFRTRFGDRPLADFGVQPGPLLGNRPLSDQIGRDAFLVSPADIADSPFNRAHAGGAALRTHTTLAGMFDRIMRIVRGAAAPSFTYAYWPKLDQLAHARGIADAGVAAHLGRIDDALAAFLNAARGTDTLLVVTADHGFMDLRPGGLVRTSEHPRLKDTLLLPLCGEPRAAYCYVAPGRAADFRAGVEHALAGRGVAVASEELIADGFFGPGDAHPELRSRVGDWTLIMREGCAIVDDTADGRFTLTGVHGGISTAELEVPLIVAEL